MGRSGGLRVEPLGLPVAAEYSADGKMWPRPTFMKLMPGDAVLILGHTPHAASRCTFKH